MTTIVSRVSTIALDSSLDLGEIRHRHIDHDPCEIALRDNDSRQDLTTTDGLAADTRGLPALSSPRSDQDRLRLGSLPA